MSRVAILTPAKLELVQQLVKEGKEPAEIAATMGVTLGSLRVICCRHKISLCNANNPRKKRVRDNSITFQIRLSPDSALYLHDHAIKKGITRMTLAAKLLEYIAKDNLYQAVLDE